MKTLDEVIEDLTLRQFMKDSSHWIKPEEMKEPLWYLRNYRDLLQTLSRICKDTDFIKNQYLRDMEK